MLYFYTRTQARQFAVKSNKKVVDLGSDANLNRRWAVKVITK